MYQFTSPIISEIIFCDYTVVIEIGYASPIWLCKIVNFSINRNLNSESGLAHLAELISSICGVIMFKYRMPIFKSLIPYLLEHKGRVIFKNVWILSFLFCLLTILMVKNFTKITEKTVLCPYEFQFRSS